MNLYVDPGKLHAAAALFASRRLLDARLFRASTKDAAAASADIAEQIFEWQADLRPTAPLAVVACERPSIWTQGGSRGNPNDVLDLMATNGAIMHAVYADRRKYITTNDWKGQVPKPKKKGDLYIIEHRVMKRLSPEEVSMLGDNPDHNVIDAVGIGLWDLKRL